MAAGRIKVVTVVAFAAALTIVGTWATQVAAQDARLRACAVTSETPVAATFSLARASDIDSHFPSASHFFEFDGVSDAAFVVVFAGPVTLPAMHPVAAPGQNSVSNMTYNNVVCILVGDRAAFYYNVNESGLSS